MLATPSETVGEGKSEVRMRIKLYYDYDYLPDADRVPLRITSCYYCDVSGLPVEAGRAHEV